MSPLFSQLPSDRTTSFSCGHIIPETSLRTIVVGKGPRGGELEYKARKQGEETVIGELGQILLNFAALVPRGMIVFFSSYRFLNTAKEVWPKSGILGRFEEGDMNGLDHSYALTSCPVIRGINFADDLARAVVIVGLPFANLGSPELRERMKYVKQLEEKRGTRRPPGQKDAAAELYENMCMNAVN
ncbi:helicase C-terminal domain-containing protein [Mycena maculata]|uniref:Helicase C-terminal domain-containing protein n=1 Tax=Mycena maculata TaxID=230809 RepID=A0AAD7MT93_9AGAR|nr:helicase C-terminal domain-containing protein [Mycena maculata]